MSRELPVYVNVYDKGERFGGHEEGGWTYNTYTLKESLKSWCDCPADQVVRRWFDDEQEITIYELSPWISDHYMPDVISRSLLTESEKADIHCQAGLLAKQIRDQWDEEGAKATYLESFITAGGTYDMNSADDAPSEFTHEAITGGEIHVRIEDKKGEDWNNYRPYS